MVLGRLAHYAVDGVLLSTVIAGVKRSSGFSSVYHVFSICHILLTQIPHRLDTSKISDSTARSLAEKFLSVGETVFDMVQGTAVNSAYFKRST